MIMTWFSTFLEKHRAPHLRIQDLPLWFSGWEVLHLQAFCTPKILFPWSLQLDWVHPHLFQLCMITKKVLLVVSDAEVGFIVSALAVLPFCLLVCFLFFFLLFNVLENWTSPFGIFGKLELKRKLISPNFFLCEYGGIFLLVFFNPVLTL